MVDTGFTDGVTIPPDVVRELGLALPVYRVRLLSHGREYAVRAYAAPGGPLVDLALWRGSRFTMEVVSGGEVVVEDPR